MITKSFRLEDLERVKICIGYVGENEHTQVRIDCSSAFAEYPGATPALAVKPPRGGVYPAVIETDGNIVVWTVTNSDLLFRGEGEIQFSFTLGDVIKKTAVGKFDVHRSIITTANVPDPVAEWLVRATAAAAAAEAAAQHQPKIENEYWYVWDADAEEYVSTGIKAKGDKGDPGTPGDPTTLIDDTSTALDKTWSAHELDGLKNALNGVDSDLYSYEYLPVPAEEIISTADLEMETGYVTPNGDSTGGTLTYHHTKKIAVTEGDVIQYIIDRTHYVLNIRFVCAYNGDTAVTAKGSNDTVTSYTVPDGITHVVLSIANGDIFDEANLHRNYTVPGQKTKVFDVGDYVKRNSKIGNVITGEKDTLSANTDYVLASNIDNRKNENIDLWCKFDSFDSITVGHGKGTYGGYIVIDATYAKVYYNGTVYKTYTHGLTISDFIEIHVIQGDLAVAYFSITTSTGQWKATESALWHGCKGDVYCSATMAISNIRFSTIYPDMKKDVFVFGDSYTTMGDTSKWPYYAKSIYSAGNLAIFGYGGVGTADEIVCFRKVLEMVKPKVVAWFIGMNDGDSSTAINSAWKTGVDEVIQTCTQNGIKIVLATIPNTPTVRNTFKNQYVKDSGCYYVDFAKAVNAESAGATWYTGMLDNDNTHPTALGAKALCARLIADLPQII